jgi:hypothetical protein
MCVLLRSVCRRLPAGRGDLSLSSSGYIYPEIDLAATPFVSLPEGPGVGSSGLCRSEDAAGRSVGHPTSVFGIDRAGLVLVRVGGSGLWVEHLGRDGLGFAAGNDIAWLQASGFLLLLLATPFGDVDLWLRERGCGLVLGLGMAAVGDQAFDGYDHGHGFNLAGDAAPGGFRAQIGQFPEPGQGLVATQVAPAQGFDFLVYELCRDGGAVFFHVGADARFGFGVGRGVGVKTGCFRGFAVSHGSGHEVVRKLYLLIGDEIVDYVFGHTWFSPVFRGLAQSRGRLL